MMDLIGTFANGFLVFACVGFDVFRETETAKLIVSEFFRIFEIMIGAADVWRLDDATNGLPCCGVFGERGIGHFLHDFENLAWLTIF